MKNRPKADFHQVNQALRDSADKANRYANLVMPINANIGNLSYVLCAIVGAPSRAKRLCRADSWHIDCFVGLNKSFTQPITQISQQMNFIVMAAAGAQRVFRLLDEKPEEDHGYVELVNARETGDGQLTECEERTQTYGHGSIPHKQEGHCHLYRLEGGVVFDHVDFGYDERKMVFA